MYDIIIIGAGPAGLTAALYALRANKKILIFEAKTYGGQILAANKIENYPGIDSISGYDFATNLYNQVSNLGAEFKFESVLRIDDDNAVITKDGKYYAKAIILAIGSKNRKLNIAKETEFTGKGVSYCATCDGNFYKNKDVALVGGGNTALEDAIYLSDIVNKVYLIHRKDSFRAEEKYQEELKKKSNIEVIMNANIIKLNGENRLESIDLDNGMNISVDGLFIAVGQEPNNEIFSNIVDLNEKGYIKSIDGVHTNKKHIYVAGDAREKMLRQLVTAESDGAIAATTAIREMED